MVNCIALGTQPLSCVGFVMIYRKGTVHFLMQHSRVSHKKLSVNYNTSMA